VIFNSKGQRLAVWREEIQRFKYTFRSHALVKGRKSGFLSLVYRLIWSQMLHFDVTLLDFYRDFNS